MAGIAPVRDGSGSPRVGVPWSTKTSGENHFWYAILTRVQNRVCVITRWQETPNSRNRYAVVLADETVQGNTRGYTWVDDAGLYFITSGLTATEIASGGDRIVSGTTGNSTKNAFYGLSGSFSFEPATGPGANWGAAALRVANHYCTRMRQAH